MYPNQAALCKMGIFTNFMRHIAEDERWSGRTQSGASWSSEQLRRDLRLQLETVEVGGKTDGALPIHQEISPPSASNVRLMESSRSRYVLMR